MRTIAALSVLAVAVVLALLLWLFTRSELPEEKPTAQVIPAVPSTETREVDSAAERETVELTGPAPEALPKPPIPESLAQVFDESRDLIARMKAVDALSDSQPPEALAALRWLLQGTGGDEALRNNTANKLRRSSEKHLVDDLTGMARNERETPKWRNYCIQHLYNCYEERPDTAILDTLFKAADPAQTKEKMVRICAVWSLARVATPRDRRRTPDGETVERIRAAALGALREKDAHFLIRTAGVQSCARLALKEALPDIRKLAADERTRPTHLRVVSSAALGDLGDDSDLPFLARLASSARGQVKSAAALALKKIKKRAAQAERETAAPEKAPAAPSKPAKDEPHF